MDVFLFSSWKSPIQSKIRVNWEESVPKMVEIVAAEEHVMDYTEYIKEERDVYLTIYTSIIVFSIVIFVTRSFSFFHMFVRISINLHDMIFRGVSRANMIFFNNNPSGRILNRFARDINNIDTLLPKVLFDVCEVINFNLNLISFFCLWISLVLSYDFSASWTMWELL